MIIRVPEKIKKIPIVSNKSGFILNIKYSDREDNKIPFNRINVILKASSYFNENIKKIIPIGPKNILIDE